MTYAVIQSPSATVNNKLWAVIELHVMNGYQSYVSPAGYVVGAYRVVKDNFKHKIVADTLCKDLNKEL